MASLFDKIISNAKCPLCPFFFERPPAEMDENFKAIQMNAIKTRIDAHIQYHTQHDGITDDSQF